MVKLSDIDLPIIFKNQLLFKAGKHNPISNNNFSFNSKMVEDSVKNTKWSALNKRIYLKHDGAYDVSKWKGNVENIKAEKGEVRGDVQIWDAEEGIQILYGGKPIALSADIEHNENDIMYFTGFALENSPGINDYQMFLSDSVKDELSGMYHAKFSNELDVTNIEQNKIETQSNPIDTQSAERRLLNDKQTDTMTEETKNENEVKTEQVKESNDSILAKQLVEKMENIEKNMATEFAKLQPKEEVKEVKEDVVQDKPEVIPEVKPEVKEEGTVANTSIPTITEQVLDDKIVESIADKVAERIKSSFPEPITINEFGADVVDDETRTVNRLTESLAKM